MSDIELERSYIKRLAPQLKLFEQTDSNVYTCRCPLCGDSRKSKTKKRGNIYIHDNTWMFHCYNCNESMQFKTFMKRIDYPLYQEFMRNHVLKSTSYENITYKPRQPAKPSGTSEPEIGSPEIIVPKLEDKSTIFSTLEPLYTLDEHHEATKYCVGRVLPKRAYHSFYYTDNFNEWSNSVFKGKELKTSKKYAGIVIPLISDSGIEFGYQCRFLSGDMRYMTVIMDKRFTKVFGMHMVDKSKPIFVTEGAFDSIYFPNGIAALDGSLHSTCERLQLDKERCILVYDNQPLNTHVTKSITRAIEAGWTIGFFPDWARPMGKDVNEIMIKQPDLKSFIGDMKILKGAKAKLELIQL